jgi:hypothetical protein
MIRSSLSKFIILFPLLIYEAIIARIEPLGKRFFALFSVCRNPNLLSFVLGELAPQNRSNYPQHRKA